jgi:hypothetical protein
LAWLALWSLSVSANPVNQHIFSDKSGLLRRFTFCGEQETNEVLALAKVSIIIFCAIYLLTYRNHLKNHDLDIWQLTPSYIDLYSPPSSLSLPASLLSFPHTETVIPRPETKRPATARSDWNLTYFANSTYHASYHPLYEVDGFIRDIAALYPDFVHVVELGHSGEGREMLGMRISKPGTVGLPKKGFVIIGAQHAREVCLSVRFDSE